VDEFSLIFSLLSKVKWGYEVNFFFIAFSKITFDGEQESEVSFSPNFSSFLIRLHFILVIGAIWDNGVFRLPQKPSFTPKMTNLQMWPHF